METIKAVRRSESRIQPNEHVSVVVLQEYKQKLARVTQVRKELKSHIQSLPDLSLLPNVTGGLAPLPSAGDLFSTDWSLHPQSGLWFHRHQPISWDQARSSASGLCVRFLEGKK